MNGYPKEIFHNHVKKFLSEKLMTTNSCQNMNDEKKCTVIIPFIGHPFINYKKSSTIGVVVRMSILDTKVTGSNLSINMFSP